MRFVVLLCFLVACAKGAQIDPDPSPDAPAADASPPTESEPPSTTCLQSFRLDGYSIAVTVWLTGSMTAWGEDPAHGAIEFAKGVDGAWTGSCELVLGTYQYKFIVDGDTWLTDPTNPDVVDDGSGNTNSVFRCVP